MKKKPSPSAAAINKARDLFHKGMHRQAEDVYRMILLGDPDDTSAMLDLGLLLAQRGETAEPRELYTKVLAADPRHAGATIALAVTLIEAGERDEALRMADRARTLRPDAKALGRLGVFYSRAGHKDAAAECLQSAIRLAPDDVTSYFALQRLKKLSIGDPLFAGLLRLEKQAAALPAPAPARATLHFTLGNIYIDADLPEKAFHHYAEGNRIKKGVVYFNMEQHERQIEAMLRLFATFPDINGGDESEQPVFIVGMPRSGSTLVDQILASHPEARGMGEVTLFQDSLPDRLQTNPEAATLADLTPEVLGATARKYLALTAPYAGGALRLGNKMLSNFFWLGIIRLALPRAKIIHCTREPLDTALSIWQTMFADNMVPWGYDPEDIGRYYRSYRKMMAHWHNLFPGAIFEANYERLVTAPEAETRRLIDYCGLGWDDRCLKFHETARLVKTASADQVRRPLYTSAAGKGKKYENWLHPLREALEKP